MKTRSISPAVLLRLQEAVRSGGTAVISAPDQEVARATQLEVTDRLSHLPYLQAIIEPPAGPGEPFRTRIYALS